VRKARVEFKYKRIAEDEWQIEAHYPGAELRHIKGFKSKAEVDEWKSVASIGRGRRGTRNDAGGAASP
jgi:hypothetical protein